VVSHVAFIDGPNLLDFGDEDRGASDREVGQVSDGRLASGGAQAGLHLLWAVEPKLEHAVVGRAAALRSTHHSGLLETVTSRDLRDQRHVSPSVVTLGRFRVRGVPTEDGKFQHPRLLPRRPLLADLPPARPEDGMAVFVPATVPNGYQSL